MQKYLCLILFLLFTFIPYSYASGGVTHMFIAQESIKYIPDATLRNLLLNNMDAYLVGSYYPDSGYVKGTHYGEDSHWDEFIYAFSDHIKEKYADPTIQAPQLVAFLFGCATHRVSDEIMHGTFYPIMKDKDFNGNGDKAHAYGDFGIDILLIIDKNSFLQQPANWWVPVEDLLAVYHRMGRDQYTADEIKHGNAVISKLGGAERAIAPINYPILKWRMPWTAANYYDWPEGGIVMNEKQAATYQMNLWKRLIISKL